MQTVRNQHIIEVQALITVKLKLFRPCMIFGHTCKAEMNFESMKLWQQYPDLAVFPGSLLLEDKRPEDATYASKSLSPDQLAAQEPALSLEASRKGARLYASEGLHHIFHIVFCYTSSSLLCS